MRYSPCSHAAYPVDGGRRRRSSGISKTTAASQYVAGDAFQGLNLGGSLVARGLVTGSSGGGARFMFDCFAYRFFCGFSRTSNVSRRTSVFRINCGGFSSLIGGFFKLTMDVTWDSLLVLMKKIAC